MKSKILILTTYFPPKNHIASSRMLSFAEYLSDVFDVTVITHSNSHGQGVKSQHDKYKIIYIDNGFLDAILALEKTDNKVERLFKLIFRKIFFKLNISFFHSWSIKAKKKFKEEVYNNKPQYILTSFMPIDTHEICFDILNKDKKLDDIFWIADMRDEMSEHISNNEKQRKILKRKEDLYGKRVNLITSVSLPILNQFKSNMKYVKNFLEIRNGFNHDISVEYYKKDKLKIGYFGTFYGDIKPDNFFLALLGFEFIDDLEVYIASSSHNYIIPEKLKSNVKQMDFLTYEESIKVMAEMDCNLLILPFNGARQGVYSGKIFDYLSVTRPILALVNQSDVAADLIKEFGCGYFAEPENVDSIRTNIYNIYSDWAECKLKMADREAVAKLHRKNQVNILKNFLLSQVNKDNEG